MKSTLFVYNYEGKAYNVFVTKHSQNNIYYRYRTDGFHISAPYFTSMGVIVKGLEKFAGRLLKQYNQRNNNISEENDEVYLLGNLVKISSLPLTEKVSLEGYLKALLKETLTSLVRKNETIMGIEEPYKISVRKTVCQFGSNSKQTHRLSFQLNLVHYSPEIIESVVIHELAHDTYRNHQKEFYDLVYKYCPNYDIVQKKLKKGIHA